MKPLSNKIIPPAISLQRRHVLKQLALGFAAAASPFAIGVHSPENLRKNLSTLVIRGGLVANASGCALQDVLVEGGKITRLGKSVSEVFSEGKPNIQVIDATGLQILPGGIDPHVHLGAPYADDFLSGSRAALAGGITTVGQMAFLKPEEALQDMVKRYTLQVHAKSMVDVMLHPVLWDTPAASELSSLANSGHTSFKVFLMADHFDENISSYQAVLKEAEKLGMLAMLHCEDANIISLAQQDLKKQGHDCEVKEK